ncbi:hypothetical protein [Dickeya ananatis]
MIARWLPNAVALANFTAPIFVSKAKYFVLMQITHTVNKVGCRSGIGDAGVLTGDNQPAEPRL